MALTFLHFSPEKQAEQTGRYHEITLEERSHRRVADRHDCRRPGGKLKISVAAEPYPPFASQDASGKWVGFEVELIDALCAEAKLECETVGTAWDGIIPALTSKKIDAIVASMSITEERSKTIAFSIPYYNTPAMLIAAKETRSISRRKA